MQPFLPALSRLQPILGSSFRRKSDNILVRANLNPPRAKSTGGLEDEYRLLKVGKLTPVRPGDVLIGGTGRRYLLLGGHRDERQGEGKAVFKSLELNFVSKVFRATKVLDTKTKRTNEIFVEVGSIDFAETPLRQEMDTLNIPFGRYDIVTDFELRVGDKLLQGTPQITSNGLVDYAKALEKLSASFGYGAGGYGQYGYGQPSDPGEIDNAKLVVQEVEIRQGVYWARLRDV